MADRTAPKLRHATILIKTDPVSWRGRTRALRTTRRCKPMRGSTFTASAYGIVRSKKLFENGQKGSEGGEEEIEKRGKKGGNEDGCEARYRLQDDLIALPHAFTIHFDLRRLKYRISQGCRLTI